MPTTTFRADAVAALVAVLNTRKSTSPTLLRKVYTARPGSFSELPCAYVGERHETMTHGMAGHRERRLTGLSVVVVDSLPDAEQTEDRMDILIDLLVEDFTSAKHPTAFAGSGELLLAGVQDADIDLTGPEVVTHYRGAILSFGDTWLREGRG